MNLPWGHARSHKTNKQTHKQKTDRQAKYIYNFVYRSTGLKMAISLVSENCSDQETMKLEYGKNGEGVGEERAEKNKGWTQNYKAVYLERKTFLSYSYNLQKTKSLLELGIKRVQMVQFLVLGGKN